jgi:hypothetical protein
MRTTDPRTGAPLHPDEILENLGGRIRALAALGLLLIEQDGAVDSGIIKGAALGMFYLEEDLDEARAGILAWLEANRGAERRPETGGAR